MENGNVDPIFMASAALSTGLHPYIPRKSLESFRRVSNNREHFFALTECSILHYRKIYLEYTYK